MHRTAIGRTLPALVAAASVTLLPVPGTTPVRAAGAAVATGSRHRSGSTTAARKPTVLPPTPTQVLQNALGPAVLPGARVSAVLLNASQGLRSLAATNPGMRLPPGRLEDMLTLAAALWHLGPAFRTDTEILAPTPHRGVILGNIVVRGGGDVTLSAATLAVMAQQVAHRVHEIDGAVLADASLFSFPVLPPGWPYGTVAAGAVPGAAALSVQQDQVVVTVSPAARAGLPASVTVNPAGSLSVIGTVTTGPAAVATHGSAGTGGARSGAASPASRSAGKTHGTGSRTPAVGTVLTQANAPTVSLAPSGTAVSVSGEIPQGASPLSVTLWPPSPARIAADVLRADLVHDHVVVTGGTGIGLPIPRAVVLARAASIPLAEWSPTVLAPESALPSPLPAETVDRLLCGPTPARPCGEAASERIVAAFLQHIGAPLGEVITDGSGLSVQDEVPALALARTLGVGLMHAWGAPLVHGLAPLSAPWNGLPTGTLGLAFTDVTGGQAGILALVPFTRTVKGQSVHDTAVYAALAVDPDVPSATLARVLVHAAVASLATVSSSSSTATASSPTVRVRGTAGSTSSVEVPAAAARTPTVDSSLLRALNAAGPGSSVAATLWPVGSTAPSFDWNGATLEPAPGAPAVLLGGAALAARRVPLATQTRAVIDGTLEGSTLYGSIGLIGGSDPTLDEGTLTTLAREIAALGIRRVTGGITADDAALPLTMDADWPWQVSAKPPYLPQDALMSPLLDLFSVAVLPGRRVGASPQVTVVPTGLPVRIDNEALTTPGHTSDLHLWPVPGVNRFVLTGTIGAAVRLGVVYLRVFPSPALATAQLFRQALVAAGVQVADSVALAPVPPEAPLLAALPTASPAALLSSLVASPNPAVTADAAQRMGGAAEALALASVEATAALWGDAPAAHLVSLFGLGPNTALTSSDMAHALALMQAASTSNAPTKGPGSHTAPPLSGLAALMPSLAPGVRGVVVTSPSMGEVGLYGFFLTPQHRLVAFTILASALNRPSTGLATAVVAALARLARMSA